ncbi:peptidase [Sulfurifustis variabilis]|uniref:Peptidase n=1 Tax=Sulfurifustis variabilis TaxID=1675686 RepID=A0A1B4V046_9GAMM|nr:PepSY domain-containing protein [Sulfurifustis variabilis]BAU46810.1 peptidase [Sulfurifustis variabilis]
MKRLIAAALGAVVFALGASSLIASDDHERARALREQGEVLPLERILEKVRERHPNVRIIETELERKDGRYVYEIEVAGDNGVVHELKYDARTAELLKEKREK